MRVEGELFQVQLIETAMLNIVGHQTLIATKANRIVRAAQHYLMGLPVLPPCRFDVVAVDGDQLQWLPGAFDAA